MASDESADTKAPARSKWEQTAHAGKGRVRPRRNQPVSDVPRLTAVAHL